MLIAKTESKEQEEFFARLKLLEKDLYEFLFAIPNGSHKTMATAMKFKREGLKAGVPDVFFAYPKHGYCGLFIEFKTVTGGRLSNFQKSWLTRLGMVGYASVVANGCHAGLGAFYAYLDGTIQTYEHVYEASEPQQETVYGEDW